MNALTKDIEEASKAIVQSVAKEAIGAKNLREFNELMTSRDPSRVAWPATLTLELALKTASPQELKDHYEFSDEEWLALKDNPVFLAELKEQCELVRQEGMSFRMKARLQSEAMLETQWRLVHAPTSEVPAAVKARMIETTFRVAGYDTKSDGGANGFGNQLNIQIHLG